MLRRRFTILLYALLLLIMTASACSKQGSNPSSSFANAAYSDSDILSEIAVTPTVAVKRMDTVILTKPVLIKKKVIPTITATPSKIVAIDAGHQSKGNYKEEPIGPGAKATKPKVSSGTQGKYTGVAEYKLTLVIAKKVKKELQNRGYETIMIRETNDVNISNKERAEMANESNADILIRIHADGSVNTKVHGTSTLYPSKKNPYVSELSDSSYSLSKKIVDAICNSSGSKNRSAIARDDMSGINWSDIPVSIIEMGFMSNKKEDKLMQTKEYQNKIVKGICDGIDAYFNE